MYQSAGAGFVEMLGPEYFARAGGWELLGLTAAAVTASVLTGGVVYLAMGGGLAASVAAGAVGGGVEYLSFIGGAYALSGGTSRGPTLGGFATATLGGAAFGGALHGAGLLVGRVGSGVLARSRALLQSRSARTLYVHVRESDYQQVLRTGFLGRGYRGARRILGPPFDEGRIWATPYTREQFTGWRAALSGFRGKDLAQLTRTITITDEAADAFSLAFGPRFSWNPYGWLKGFGRQYQFRGQLPYQSGMTIRSLAGASRYTFAQNVVFGLGELERLGIYSGAIAGGASVISAAIGRRR